MHVLVSSMIEDVLDIYRINEASLVPILVASLHITIPALGTTCIAISIDSKSQDLSLAKSTIQDARVFSRRPPIGDSCSLSILYSGFGGDGIEYMLRIPISKSWIYPQSLASNPIAIAWERLVEAGAYFHLLGPPTVDEFTFRFRDFGLRTVVWWRKPQTPGQILHQDIFTLVYDYSPLRLALRQCQNEIRPENSFTGSVVEINLHDQAPPDLLKGKFALHRSRLEAEGQIDYGHSIWIDDALICASKGVAPSSVRFLLLTENNMSILLMSARINRKCSTSISSEF